MVCCGQINSIWKNIYYCGSHQDWDGIFGYGLIVQSYCISRIDQIGMNSTF